jgi:hypothetical protein
MQPSVKRKFFVNFIKLFAGSDDQVIGIESDDLQAKRSGYFSLPKCGSAGLKSEVAAIFRQGLVRE